MRGITICLLATALLTGCGKSPSENPKPLPPTYGVDAQFSTLVDEFYFQANSRGVTLPRNLVVVQKETLSDSLPANTIGVCYYPYSQRQYPYVEIKKSFWDDANDEARRNLIFHELGHCLLFRGHESATQFAPTIGRSIPLSIMYPYILMTMSGDVAMFYLNHIVEYFNELFDPTQMATIQGYASNAGGEGFDPNYIPDLGGFSATLDNGDCINKE